MALWMAAVSSVWPSPFAPNEFTEAPTHTARETVAEPAQRVEKRTIASVVCTVILLRRALPLPPRYVEHTMDGSCTETPSHSCHLPREGTPGSHCQPRGAQTAA